MHYNDQSHFINFVLRSSFLPLCAFKTPLIENDGKQDASRFSKGYSVGLLAARFRFQFHFEFLQNLHPAACKLLKFLSFVFGDLAIWIRVIFTLDRVVAVRHPLYFGGCCGRVFSAVVYVIVTTLASVAKNLHLFWTRGAQYKTTTIANVSRSILISNCGEPTPNFAASGEF